MVALSLAGCQTTPECGGNQLVYEPAYPGEDPRIWQNVPKVRWVDPAECGRARDMEREMGKRGL